MRGCIWSVMRRGRRLLVSHCLSLGRMSWQGTIRHSRPVQANVTIRMSADELARLILPEWGVPSGLIYSGCGMSLFPLSYSDLENVRMILIIRCDGSYDGYFCYFSSGLCKGMFLLLLPLSSFLPALPVAFPPSSFQRD